MNYLFHAKWKLDLIKILCESPKSVYDIIAVLPISERTAYRAISYLSETGFKIEKTTGSNRVAYFHITAVDPELSQIVLDLFFLIHKTEQLSSTTISEN